MHGKRALALGGWLSAGIAALHVVIAFVGPSAFRYFGAGEDMARQAEAGSFLPAALTLVLAAVFAVFALYAFAGAGMVRRPPLLRTGLAVIAAVYTLRGLALFLELVRYARDSSAVLPREMAFSFTSLTIGIAYLTGTVLLWRSLRPGSRA
jgi:hypothetical protein